MIGHLGVSTPGPFLCTTTPQPQCIDINISSSVYTGIAGDRTQVLKPDFASLIMFKFFRFANTFYNWNSFIAIFDDSVDEKMENLLYKVLSKDASLTTFRIPEGWVRIYYLFIWVRKNFFLMETFDYSVLKVNSHKFKINCQ